MDYEKTRNDFWHIALKRAIIAKRIAGYWSTKVDRDFVFVSALLCDIGLIAWLYTEPETFNGFIHLYREKKISIHEAEKNLFIFEQNKLGSLLLQLWNFPEKIINVVENHHSTVSEDPVIQIIQLAEQLGKFDPESPHNIIIENFLPIYAEKLNL